MEWSTRNLFICKSPGLHGFKRQFIETCNNNVLIRISAKRNKNLNLRKINFIFFNRNHGMGVLKLLFSHTIVLSAASVQKAITEFISQFRQFRRDTMSFTYASAVIFISTVIAVQPTQALYRFLTEDTDVLTDCPETRNMLGVADFVDYSNLAVSYEEDGIHIEGNSIIRWDVKQTDRVSMQGELKKFARGTWQQTPISVMVVDMCKDMKDNTSAMYDVWTKHVISEVVCLGKGAEYNHEPFVVKAESDVKGVNMEGRYKMELVFQAYDETNLPRSNAVCVEIPGEIIKV
uniref:MD-2-related lipid-recognition domain-containing protein n=1 Tax=Glossina brevipalpis TaxID=37001 RepID=A0A1A9WR62_9MUSC